MRTVRERRAGYEPSLAGGRSGLRRSAAVALLVTLWALGLSYFLSGGHDVPLTERINVLFHSDSPLWVERMTAEEPPTLRVSERLAHPLDIALWRRPVRPLSAALATVLTPRSAALLASRLVVAVVFGLGTGLLVLHAQRIGTPFRKCLLVLPVYLLSTSHVVASLPEHYGVSNGLLAASYALSELVAGPVPRLLVLALMTLLVGGTTVTNAVFPVTAALGRLARSQWLRVAVVAVLIVAVFGVLAYFAHHRGGLRAVERTVSENPGSLRRFVGKYLHDRLFEEPGEAAMYLGASLVYPAVGPRPRVVEVFGGTLEMISYEPWSPDAYGPLDGMAALCWLALLGVSAANGLRERRTAPLAALLLLWVLFNALFHTMWGDEMFLYSPHWSWSLFGLVLLGVRRLPEPYVAAAVAVTALGQVATLLEIRSMIGSIQP